MEDSRLIRVQQLMMQDRPKEAEVLLRKMLEGDPENTGFLALLALAKAALGDFDIAEQLIKNCMGRQPNDTYLMCILGRILLMKDELDDAWLVVTRALKLDASDAALHALLSNILLAEDRYLEALKHIDVALSLEPGDNEYLTIRAMVLSGMGQKAESSKVIEQAIAEEPEEALSHVVLGWNQLEDGRHRPALESFRTALRLEPNFEKARLGLIHALQSRYFIYRIFLSFAISTTRNYEKAKRIFTTIILTSVGFLLALRLFMEDTSVFQAIFVISLAAYLYLMWVIQPVFEFFLLFNSFGRLALIRRQKQAAYMVGAALCCSLGLGIVWLVGGNQVVGIASLVALAMVLPFGIMLRSNLRESRKLLVALSLPLLGLGLAGIVWGWRTGVAFNGLAFAFFVALFVYRSIARRTLKRG